jgi:DNA excision repair protein ERCC-5
VRTAGKLLALQMQRIAEEDEKKKHQPAQESLEEEPLPENLVYVDELQMTEQQRQQGRKFKKQDAYHLPALQASMSEMGQPNDPRVMSLEELQHYANQFNSGEDINVYDFSKIDFDSPFFQSLPASDRYNILNAARLRSRLRMGYSKDQLDKMFPDRMAFSKFQIERVTERNELTQRLMNLDNMDAEGLLAMNGTSRVAGEKGREYVLIKNDGVEGGWALGVVNTHAEGQKDKPIRVDDQDKVVDEDAVDEEEEEDEFEDVPIEGLNRLPVIQPRRHVGLAAEAVTNAARRRKAVYNSRKHATSSRPTQVPHADEDSLFVPNDAEEEWENVDMDQADVSLMSDEDEELQRAIAMSLQQESDDVEMSDDDMREVFQSQKTAAEPAPFTRGSGKAIAHVANARANKAIAKPFMDVSDDEDDITLQAALAESRRTMEMANKTNHNGSSSKVSEAGPSKAPKFPGFDGPLPFEKLDLGSSILGKKKMQKIEEELAGGFEPEQKKKAPAAPLPPWFSGSTEKEDGFKKPFEVRDPKIAQPDSSVNLVFPTKPSIRHQDSQEVVDLENYIQENKDVITILSDDESENADPEQRARSEPDKDLGDLQVEPEDTPSEIPLQPTAPLPEASALDSDDDEIEWETVSANKQAEADNTSIPKSAVQDSDTLGLGNMEEAPEEIHDVSMLDEEETGNSLLSAGIEDVQIQDGEIVENYSDPEDEDLFRQLAQEEEEHARFTSSLNNRSAAVTTIDFEKELKQLRNQQKKDRRDADEVTQNMITECQQLLSLFGLPYITAPMEAEAQCAELVRLGLVDGIVTDDSDVFLFGGTRVYKNMFNQAKLVECYLAPDLEAEFGLSRQRLIAIAQLLGSDYTEGLPGVGPVTALEILSEFDDLSSFKRWWTAVQAGTQKKEDDAWSDFRKKFRRNSTKVFLPSAFPDARVDEAYLQPEVDSDPSPFVWGVPDLDALRSFLMSQIGWNEFRVDEVLVPVIRDMNRKVTEGTQSNITAFFGGSTGAGAFAPRVRGQGSRRLETALHRIGQKGPVKPIKGTASQKSQGTKRRQVAQVENWTDEEEVEADAEYAEIPKKRTRQRAKK